MEANKIFAPRPEANMILAPRQICEMQQGIQLNDMKLDMLYELRKLNLTLWNEIRYG